MSIYMYQYVLYVPTGTSFLYLHDEECTKKFLSCPPHCVFINREKEGLHAVSVCTVEPPRHIRDGKGTLLLRGRGGEGNFPFTSRLDLSYFQLVTTGNGL